MRAVGSLDKVIEYRSARRVENPAGPSPAHPLLLNCLPVTLLQSFHDIVEALLDDITPHVLRHSFASIANDLGLTETTIASLLGHAKGSVTGRYIHTLDPLLTAAADMVAGYIQGLLDGVHYKQTAYAHDYDSRKQALASFLASAVGEEHDVDASGESLAA